MFKVRLFVVGAAKAGTSWLDAALREHAATAMPIFKETNFFSREYDRGIEWYHSLYPTRIGMGCDVSPSYLSAKEAPARIKSYNDDAKLVVILRNPVERAISQYNTIVRGGRSGLSWEEIMSPDGKVLQDGCYFKWVTNYSRVFDDQNFLVMFFEDLKKRPDDLLRSMYKFVGLDYLEPGVLRSTVNEARGVPKYPRLYRILVRVTSKAMTSRLLNPVARKLTSSRLARSFHRINDSGMRPSIPEHAKDELLEYYRSDVELLSRYTGRDLSHWLT